MTIVISESWFHFADFWKETELQPYFQIDGQFWMKVKVNPKIMTLSHTS